jgi:hypothetical protein
MNSSLTAQRFSMNVHRRMEDGNSDRRAVDREPHGLLPRDGTEAPARVGRFVIRLFRARDEIDQEGLLVGRTLGVAERRPRPDGD